MIKKIEVATLSDVEHLMNASWQWSLNEKDELLATFDLNGSKFVERLVLDEHLAIAHPALPVLLRTDLKHQRVHTKNASMPGSCGYQTFNLLLHKGVTVTDIKANKYLFSELDDIVPADTTPGGNKDFVDMQGTACTTSLIDFEGQSYHLVKTTQWAVIRVEKYELEVRYPGWAQRWLIGKELGVTGLSLIRHVFEQGPSPTADLGEIHFE